MRDIRPIALCNVLYKIIAKVLANRLKAILPHLISDTQSAFVPGRSILDNVIIAFEMLHSMKRKFRGKVGKVAMKIDISKAYDRVSWAFVEDVMAEIGFATDWIERIMLCVSTVSYTVLINGEELGPIIP